MPLTQKQIIEQSKFTYSPSGKAFEEETKKQVGALKSLDLSNKKDELNHIWGKFLHILINDLVKS